MMRYRIETTIEINASAATVWSVLTDFRQMPEWNPFIKSISGELKPGSQLMVHIAPPGKSGMRFKPTVIAVKPDCELRWVGRLFFPGVFDGEHYFLIRPQGDGKVVLTHGENFSGLLVGVMRGALSTTEEGFRLMNAALKTRAEQAANS